MRMENQMVPNRGDNARQANAAGLAYLLINLRVHFLHRNHLLGGIRVQRHRRRETAVQGGVVMHFVLQRAAADQIRS